MALNSLLCADVPLRTYTLTLPLRLSLLFLQLLLLPQPIFMLTVS